MRRRARRFGRVVGAALLVSALAAGSAHGEKRYDADRYDVRIRLESDGTMRVTESVVFHFQGGTFTQVRRELPLGRTDGIQVISAGLDGAEIPIGRKAGERRLETSRQDNRLRAVWRFPAIDGTHTFALTYLVRGLVQAGDGEDVLAWAALPRDHDYRIASSRVTIEWPESARLRSLTADGKALDADALGAAIDLRDLDEDDSVTLRATFDPGTASPRPPGWQQRAAYRRQVAPTWAVLAGALFVVASAFFWFFWARSPRPAGHEAPGSEAVPSPPADMPPALAGALTAGGGGPSAHHLMGALLDLARRGLVRVEELPKGRWGSRKFVVRRSGAKVGQDVQRTEGPDRWRRAPVAAEWLRPHEQAILETVFSHKGRVEDEVQMSTVGTRLARGSGAITRAVRQELSAAGLLDQDRLRSRHRMMKAAAVVLVLGLVSILAAIPLADLHGGWPFLLPLAAVLSSVVGFVLAASLPAQTDEGLRQGQRWKRYGRYLHRAARKSETAVPVSADVLPFAAAFGAAAGYAAAMQRRGAQMPEWFQAASAADEERSAAFVALMTTTAASGSAGGAGAGGGAAGGGSSSAH